MNNSRPDFTDIHNSQTHQMSSKLFISIPTGIFGFLGLPGNILMILLTLKTPRIRNQNYSWLLLNLGIVDFTYCFQNAFLQSVFVIHSESFFCKLAGFLEYHVGLMGFFMPALVALNRYVMVVHEHMYDRWFSNRNMILLNFFPLSWCSVVFFPYALNGWFGPEPLGVCGLLVPTSVTFNMYFIVTTIVPVLGSYIMVVFCYNGFCRKIRSHAQSTSYFRSPLIRESRSIMKATKLICYIPLFVQFPSVLMKVVMSTGLVEINPWVLSCLIIFFPLNSSSNPYINLFVVKPYKREIKKWLHSRRHLRMQNGSYRMSTRSSTSTQGRSSKMEMIDHEQTHRGTQTTESNLMEIQIMQPHAEQRTEQG